MTTLYEIADDVLRLEHLLVASEGEITPEIQELMDQLAVDMPDKVDAYGFLLKGLEADEKAFDAEAEARMAAIIVPLKRKAQVAKNNQARIKEWVKRNMERLGTRELGGDTWRLVIQKHGGKPALRLLTEDPTAFPPEYQRHRLEVDTQAVRIAVEHGLISPELAVLEPIGESVRIR